MTLLVAAGGTFVAPLVLSPHTTALPPCVTPATKVLPTEIDVSGGRFAGGAMAGDAPQTTTLPSARSAALGA